MLVAVATLVVYAPVRHFAFVNFDDPVYVIDNPAVRGGLTFAHVAWAFTTGYAGNWHPLTWLSHMVDCQAFGLEAGGHHVVNVLLHVANALLLQLVLSRITGAPWRATFVAALFALHPLHVESVAWISERKDVLSTFFWMLTMGAYVRAVERPTAGRRAAVAGVFALGLMAKQMLVTLPVVLLLLDWWPLGRVGPGRESWQTVVREKLPLFLLSLTASVVVFVAQRSGGTMAAWDAVSPGARIVNALLSYWRYLGAAVWPVDLAVFYPRRVLPVWSGVVAGTALAGTTVVLLRAGSARPYLAVGWLWFLITLLPVIGLVQVGRQALADRFTYVPMIGPFIALTWGVGDLSAARRLPVFALRLAAGATVLACAALSARQVSYWRDSMTLFEHALAVTRDNDMAENNLGEALARSGHFDEAAAHYTEAVRVNPRNPEARLNLGNAAYRTGRLADAETQIREALRLKSDLPQGQNSLGVTLAAAGKLDEAVARYEEALRLRDDYGEARVNLANALAEQGRPGEAIGQYREALRRDPRDEYAHYGLGTVLLHRGEVEEGVAELREALRLRPGWKLVEAALATAGGGP